MSLNNYKILLSSWWLHPLEICDLLGYFAAYTDNSLPTFRYNIWDTTLSEPLRQRFSRSSIENLKSFIHFMLYRLNHWY